MAEPLPESLLNVARIGPHAFAGLTQGEIWAVLSIDQRSRIGDNLGVSAAELDTVVSTETLYSRRPILAANALLVAGRQPPASHGDAWEGLMGLGGTLSDHELSKIAPRALDGFRELASGAATEVKASDALTILGNHGWEWNEKERRTKRPAQAGLAQGRPKELLTEVAVALFREWHDDRDVNVPMRIVGRVRRALQWFFQPELLKPRPFEQRIRNGL